MKKLSLIFFIFLLTFKTYSQKIGETISVINATNKKVLFYNHNLVNVGILNSLKPGDTTIINCLSNFNPKDPFLLFSANHLNNYPFFVRPGNTYEFFTDKEGKLDLRCKNIPKDNDECSFLKKLVINTDYLDEFPFRKHLSKSTSLKERDQYINNLMKERLAFFEKESKKYLFKQDFIETVKLIIKSYAIKDKFVWDEIFFNRTKILAFYKKNSHLILQHFSKSDLLNIYPYRFALSEILKIEPEILNPDNLSIAGLEYVRFLKILDFYSTNNIQTDSSIINININGITNYYLLNYLNNVRNRRQFPNKRMVKDFKGNILSFDSLLLIKNEQIILVDFWASWCLPCIEEIPYIKSLKEEFEKSNIQFLSFSIDADENSWKLKCKELGLTMSSYLILNPEKFEFKNGQKIITIPSFNLFSQNKNLFNLPYPSTGKLNDIITQNLQ